MGRKFDKKKEKDKASHLLRLKIFVFIGLIGYILIAVMNIKSLKSSINSIESFSHLGREGGKGEHIYILNIAYPPFASCPDFG